MYSVHIGTTVIFTSAQVSLGRGIGISTNCACFTPEITAFFIVPSMESPFPIVYWFMDQYRFSRIERSGLVSVEIRENP